MDEADGDLAVAVANGDPTALAAVYDRYSDRIFDFCNSILHDREEAADACQHCFLTAAQKLEMLRDPTKMKSWLYAVAKHDCLRRLKRRSREVTDQEGIERIENVEADPESLNSFDSESLRELVWSAAEGMAPRDRALLELHVRQGLDGQELADAMGVKPSHLYVMINRVKSQFERAMSALLVARLGRRDCPELESILTRSDDQFTVLLRKRIARHIDDCNTCQESRRRFASPLALLAAMPMVSVPPALRERVLQNPAAPAANEGSPGTSTPKLSSRSGFPKNAALVSIRPAGVVISAAAVTAIAIAALMLAAPTPSPRTGHSLISGQIVHHQVALPQTEGTSNTQPTANKPATTSSVSRRSDTNGPSPVSSSPSSKALSVPTTTIPSSGSAQGQLGGTPTTTPTTTPSAGRNCSPGTNQFVAMAVTTDGAGYWVVDSQGDVTAHGDATPYPTSQVYSAPIVSITALPGSQGYLLLALDGSVYAYGAHEYGQPTSSAVACHAVAIRATPDGLGYWIALSTSTGGVFAFGDAPSFPIDAGGGSPVTAFWDTPDGQGYLLLAQNGAINGVGDASVYCQPNQDSPNLTMVGLASTGDGRGYWAVSAQGGVYACGDASYFGAANESSTEAPIVAIAPASGGTGYWILNAAGAIFTFGTAPYYP